MYYYMTRWVVKNSTNASQQEPDNQKLYVTVQMNKSKDKNKISQD